MQLAENSTHRDDVIVGVRREYDDVLPRRKLASSPHLRDERIEHLAVERTCRLIPREQRAQVVLAIVETVELEDRLAGHLAQPDYRCYLAIARPFHLVGDPRRPHAR